jgi:hypothetical protein
MRTAKTCGLDAQASRRHCERSEAIHLSSQRKAWIASSRSLLSGAHSRDPFAPRNHDWKRLSWSFESEPEIRASMLVELFSYPNATRPQ